MTDLSSLSIRDLRSGLSSRDFSARELAAAYLERIEAQRDLNAYLECSRERVLADADEADRRLARGEAGELLGIPVALKDLILTKDVLTTAGSRILNNFKPPYDATVTRKLRQAGAVLLGKTNLDEFGMGSSSENVWFGAVRNPWDKDRVAGGSSGGSAAALAAGLAPAALGTDTGGSVRQPAAFCGVVGLKPTYGRVSRYGVVAYASSLDQVGPLARSVYDCALLTQVIAGHDEADATSIPREVPSFVGCLGESIRGMRIGIPREFFVGGVAPEVEQHVRGAIDELVRQGAELVDISLPHAGLALAAYYILAPAEASSNLARYDGVRYGYRASDPRDLHDMYCRSRSEGFGAEVKRRIMIGTYVLSTGYYDAYYLRAQKVRRMIVQDFDTAFERYCDVIAAPTAPTTAFKIGEKIANPLEMYLNDIFTVPVNLAGLPAISLPCGFDSRGLPIGLQLIGRPWDEESLFMLAHVYEGSSEWHTRRPNLGM